MAAGAGDQMSGVIVVLGVGAVFLSRFFLALLKEGPNLPSRQVRVYRTEYVPPKGKGELIVMNPGGEGQARTWGSKRAAIVLVFALLLARPLHGRQAPTSPERGGSSGQEAPVTDQPIRPAVMKELEAMKARIAQLEAQLTKDGPNTTVQHAGPGNEPASSATRSDVVSQDDRGVLDFFRATTINLGIDGYYGYNFNRPVRRVNLLRAYDASSNSFSLNQANLIFEQAPDVASGRRFGARLDLQFGQATETLQGNPANELRPQAYRPVWQAHGTYILPVGKGLSVDFGKWASPSGVENNYSKDQMNYSRSYFFDFLPFYHMGVRATYQLNDGVTLGYAIVNGAQQTEDFNGFKSQMVLLTLHPTKTVSWNINYHNGQEQPDAAPGSPTPDGRLHILDSNVTWTVNPKLTFAAEGDYVINRVFSHSSPTHVEGGAAYARYQVTPKTALAARGEYLSDRGGLFTGKTQALKETTLTYEYKLADGFLMRTEWRRDFSNQPFFLTASAGVLKKEQNTATVGLMWWMGRKQGSW
jgi:Putative beta-barrel porin-2, OmpL-like. bbp2